MNARQRQSVHDAMVRLADGDRTAFDAVFDGLWPHLLAFVRRATAGRPDAEDLAQQTLVRIFSRISELDTTRDAVTWAFGIAAYEVKTFRRRVHRRREVGAEALANRPTGGTGSPESRMIQDDLIRALEEVITELSAADRAVLLPEAGPDAPGGTPAVWRKRRQRALERLKAAWRRRRG